MERKFTLMVFLIGAILTTGFLSVPSSYAVIASVGGAVVDVSGAPPSDISVGVEESDSDLLAFDENQMVVLAGDLDIDKDGTPGGPFGVGAASPTTIAGGTLVNSHYIHYDSVSDSLTNLSGSVTFQGTIIGVIFLNPNQLASNAELGLAGTSYGGAHQYEGNDMFTISGDGKTISVFNEATNGIDGIRVITEPFDNVPVGGTFIPIDQSALLLAGVQSVSMWMIPVILAGIGIGVFVIKRRN